MSKQLTTVSPSSVKIKYEDDANRLGILNQIYNVRSAKESSQKKGGRIIQVPEIIRKLKSKDLSIHAYASSCLRSHWE